MMAQHLRKKVTCAFLCLYWPAYFVLGHISLPTWTHQAGVSDKSLHFLAYFILAFLLWGAFNPYQRIRWQKTTVWWILLVIVWYGVVDEWLQGYVAGRSVDVRDFLANLAGSVSGFILLTWLTFWSASLVVTAVGLFLVTNCAKINPAQFVPVVYPAFFLCGYMFFTLLWIITLYKQPPSPQGFLYTQIGSRKWLILVFTCPVALLSVCTVFAVILKRAYTPLYPLLSLVGIIAMVGIVMLVNHTGKRTSV